MTLSTKTKQHEDYIGAVWSTAVFQISFFLYTYMYPTETSICIQCPVFVTVKMRFCLFRKEKPLTVCEVNHGWYFLSGLMSLQQRTSVTCPRPTLQFSIMLSSLKCLLPRQWLFGTTSRTPPSSNLQKNLGLLQKDAIRPDLTFIFAFICIMCSDGFNDYFSAHVKLDETSALVSHKWF